MIPVKTHLIETDTLPGREVEFTISDPRWVMRSMADLYSNRELAVTREYSTNAIDAHLEAGKGNVPIEVGLPTLFSPYFTVRDFGPGMSVEELEEIYTKFGTSTKRDSNLVNGMLGFGCKSAMAYTNTFTVTSIKNNIKAIAVVTRRPDYSIFLKIVATLHTDEPTGVEISVPVHNHAEFATKARDFYRFWLPGTVLVDGVEPKTIIGEKIDDNLYYSTLKGNGYYDQGHSFVVMGNVAYEVANPEALFRDARINYVPFIAYVPNGAVEFVPSREALKYSDHTKGALHKIVDDFSKKMWNEANDEIAKATTHIEAYTAWATWTSRIGKSLLADLTFNGDKFSDTFTVKARQWRLSAYRNSSWMVNYWEIHKMKDTLVVTGFSSVDKISSTQRVKIREYISNEGKSFAYVLLTWNKITSPWVDQTNVIDWETLKASIPRKPRQAKVGGRPKGMFDYITQNGRVYAEPLPLKGNLYYISCADEKLFEVRNILTDRKDSGSVVVLAVNRFDKFKRDNPKVLDFVTHFTNQVVLDGASLLTQDAKDLLAIGETSRSWLRTLNADRIDDPDFARFKELVSNKADHLKEYDKAFAFAVLMNKRYLFKQHRISEYDEKLLQKYPLIRNRTGLDKEHVYIYLNAAYAAKEGK